MKNFSQLWLFFFVKVTHVKQDKSLSLCVCVCGKYIYMKTRMSPSIQKAAQPVLAQRNTLQVSHWLALCHVTNHIWEVEWRKTSFVRGAAVASNRSFQARNENLQPKKKKKRADGTKANVIVAAQIQLHWILSRRTETIRNYCRRKFQKATSLIKTWEKEIQITILSLWAFKGLVCCI